MMSYASKLFDMTYKIPEAFENGKQLAFEGIIAGRCQAGSTNKCRGDTALSLYLKQKDAFHIFDHRWATFSKGGDDGRETTIEERNNPQLIYKNQRYWVKEGEDFTAIGAATFGVGNGCSDLERSQIRDERANNNTNCFPDWWRR